MRILTIFTMLTFVFTQDGAHDGTVVMTTVGSGHNVTVTMDD